MLLEWVKFNMIFLFIGIQVIIFIFILGMKKGNHLKDMSIVLISALSMFLFFYLYLARDGKYEYIRMIYWSKEVRFLSKSFFRTWSNDILIRGINMSIIMFQIGLIRVVQGIVKLDYRVIKFYRCFIFVLCLEFIIYEPSVQQMLSYICYPKFMDAYAFYNSWQPIINQTTSMINIVGVSISLVLLIKECIRIRKIPMLRNRMFILTLNICVLVIFFYSMFYRYPMFLIRVSQVADYISYKSLVLGSHYEWYRMIVWFFLICVITNLVSVTYYIMFSYKVSQQNKVINRKIEDSYLGTRILAHYLKNEILNVNAAIEEVLEIGELDEESKQTLQQTVCRCNSVFAHLDTTHQLSKVKTLELHFVDRHQWLKMIEMVAEKRKLDLEGVTLEVKEDLHLKKTLMDTYYIQEVIDNLLLNAIEAFPKKEKDRCKIEISITIQGEYAVLEVSDNGSGIPKENLAKIFEPYYSSKKTSTNWGMGLSYCHKIVKLHKGEIFVTSEIGVGTSFKILLPSYEQYHVIKENV